MTKIAIIGYSGSGKSTLAKYLGRHHQIPVLHLDTVQFLPGWQKRDDEEARKIVSEFMRQPGWVIEGNYRRYFQAERLAAADQIVFLAFSRFACLIRAYKRFFKYRNRSREDMADGCIEKMDAEFTWWILYESRTKAVRQHYRSIVTQFPEKMTVIRNQRQLNAFMHRHD